ncbi:hypothetical protein VE04_04382 [Pseudogymnoascus sp. 24MN13]|nr:hypothetical protein VE04_04382 [Pseudogymnoascus sp. 24MN13]
MSSIKIPDGLPDIVAARFQEAKESGDLLAFDSTAAVLDVNGIPTFLSQTDPLAADDLEAVYALLSAYRSAGQRLFGFFNSGPHSGASQPHRHVQFLPVESMREGLGEGEWDLLADGLAEKQAKIPFTYFAAPIKGNHSPEKLHETYLALHKMARYAMDTFEKRAGTDGGGEEMSYNLAFTDSSMIILPRRAEGMAFPTGLEDPKETGVVALNGTVPGGHAAG